MPRRWELPPDTPAPPDLLAAADGDGLLARLLERRGLESASEATAFLNPDRYVPCPPEALPGTEQAVGMILAAARRNDIVYVWGDLDADGITATAVLAEALTAAGLHVVTGLPTRAEGHGLPERAVDDALACGARLLITCDTGIGENPAIAQARARGLAVIVTDHHDLPSPELLPAADVIVNPKSLPEAHPLHELSAAGIAWLVARGLALSHGPGIPDLDRLLDLVAIGLVADLSRLTGEVRYLVQRGIQALRFTRRPGLQQLMAMGSVQVAHADEDTISYLIAPRLNAVGRLGSPEEGLRLVTTQDAIEAAALAGRIESLNRERKARSEAALAAADAQLRADPERERQPAILVEGEGWDGGILGLVASALARRYDRPAVVVSRHTDGLCTASARSVEGINVHSAILAGRHLLIREGGHPMAAGCALPCANLPEFRGLLLRSLADAVARRPEAPPLVIDAMRAPRDMDRALGSTLARLSPFGSGNPQPVLGVLGLTVVRVGTGQGGEAARFRRLHLLADDGAALRVACFGDVSPPAVGDRVDIAVNARLGFWGGQERLDTTLVDWRPAEQPSRAAFVLQGRQQVIDWRAAARGASALLGELAAEYPGRVVVWSEGQGGPEDAISRADLSRRPDAVLAVAWAPPAAEVLREGIATVAPQAVCLLPVGELAPAAVQPFLRQVAGMAQFALRSRDGVLDLQRMAARVGERLAAVRAALSVLEAEGHLVVITDGDGTVRVTAVAASPQPAAARGAALRRLEQVLEESAAFRRAYASLPLDVLLSTEGA